MSMPSPETREFTRAMFHHDDIAMAREALKRHPHMVRNPVDSAFLMHYAAREGETEFVAVLHDFGVNVNIPQGDDLPDRPIASAVCLGQVETVRWLIEHGSDINYGWGGELPFCHPLPTAIRNQNFQIVKLLVEAGADLLTKDRHHLTPLDWAVGQQDITIADYLRSKGAKLSRELPGNVAPPSNPIDDHPVARYADDVLGYSFVLPVTNVLPEPAPVTVHGAMGDPCLLFTQGWSDRTLPVPRGGEELRHAELVIPLSDADWPDGNDWSQDKHRWIVQWLIRVSQIPFEHNTWFGGQWTIISN